MNQGNSSQVVIREVLGFSIRWKPVNENLCVSV